MQMALEFVEFCWRDVPLNDYAEEQRERVETALRAALADQRVPLTAQQLDKLIEAHVGGAELADGEYSSMVMFAAAIERAHGIGGNDE
jgi:hypothetical protein